MANIMKYTAARWGRFLKHARGQDALHRFIDLFYEGVLADPLLQPPFGAGRPEHVAHPTASRPKPPVALHEQWWHAVIQFSGY
jgi:hypothetical protein